MGIRLKHVWLALASLPGLSRSAQQRRLLQEMRALCARLPQIMQQPLPRAMQALAPQSSQLELSERDVRRLADLAALLARRSPLGFCLRRSLLRYHFLGRAGLPLGVSFGARFSTNGRARGQDAERAITGHAWVTLNGDPYHELQENWRDYHVVYRWPPGEN